jgi:FkbM family methyltransferase
MKKIFIDLGAHYGSSVDLFLESFPNSQDYEIHSFECNPACCKKYKSKYPSLFLYEKAVSTSDESIDFYTGKHLSGSLRNDKLTGNIYKAKPILVESVDISSFIKKQFSPNDYIVLKIDIEGTEYDILPKMLKDGLFDGYINKLYGEWHWDRLKNISKEFHENLIQQLKQKNFTMKEWCAETQTIGE